MATDESDYDIRGVCIPPINYFFGLERFDQVESKNNKQVIDWVDIPNKGWLTDIDLVIFNIHKFVRLAAEGNPNIIELLFSDPDVHLRTSGWFEELRKNKDLFLSRKLHHRFGGYAAHQLNRIKNHKRWIDNPPQEPNRKDFKLPTKGRVLPKDQLHAVYKLIEKEIDSWRVDETDLPEDLRIQLKWEVKNYIQHIFEQLGVELGYFSLKEVEERAAIANLHFDSNFAEYVMEEKRYAAAVANWKSYNSWVKNRHPKRAELEKKWGYDSKHASHLVRLLNMAKEILTEGKVIVKRPDADYLLAIRNEGILSYEELLEWAENTHKKLDDLEKTSPLREQPKRLEISKLLTTLLESFYDDVRLNGFLS
jgi:hypothetical protein